MISHKNMLELDLRRKIYNYIQKNPSSYVREISKKMEIPKSTLRHHLLTLEKHGLINSKQEKGFKRYYSTNKLGKREKEILDILKQDVPRRILIYLMCHLIGSQLELSKTLEKKPATISYHLNKLKKLKLILDITPFNGRYSGKIPSGVKPLLVRKKVKREKIYRISRKDFELNQYTVIVLYDLLVMCKDSVSDKELLNSILFMDTTLEGLKQFSDDPKIQEKIRKIRKVKSIVIMSPDQKLDKIIETIYDACPHPYHV